MVQGCSVVMLVWNRFISDARVLREAMSLADAGADVTVIAIRGDKDPASEALSDRVRVDRVPRKSSLLFRLPIFPRLFMRRIWRVANRRLRGEEPPLKAYDDPKWWQMDRRFVLLAEELSVNFRMFQKARALRPHVVHANDVNTLVPAWLAAKCTGARLVYDAHEISADREGYHGRIWLVKLVERWCGNAADGRITTTEMRADWFRKNYHYPDMTVLQNRPVRRIVQSSDRIRRQLGIPNERPVILYQGGLQWGRGLRNLLEAVRGIPEAHLVYVGGGVQRPSLERAVAADLRGRVHFTGQVALDELADWTASADIGVQCLRNTCLNHYTTDSNKLFEYVMGGLPVVASDFPEIRKVVDEYDLGLLVNPDSIEAIREALRRLVSDEALRARYAANAKRAREHLDWASQEPMLLSLYGRVLERRE